MDAGVEVATTSNTKELDIDSRFKIPELRKWVLKNLPCENEDHTNPPQSRYVKWSSAVDDDEIHEEQTTEKPEEKEDKSSIKINERLIWPAMFVGWTKKE